ncbi:MAG TPA: hypothetical protein VH208_09765, partial [Myxococcaceae bacterium]|nr:hypothetical protein [Myxococcaceae bacterium]
ADSFEHLELGDDRFALVYLRAIDAEGKAIPRDLATAFQALRKSLEEDGDPGLAASCALEAACAKGFDARLECAVLAFEPRHMTMTPYNAGCRDADWWVSQEEGRTISIDRSHSPLERKLLRQQGDHFTNGRPVQFAAGDLFVLVSAGFAGRGSRGYSNAIHDLVESLNAHLGEEPLRVVTLAKNAFWDARNGHSEAHLPPVGDVTVAAVRAVPPPLLEKLPSAVEPLVHKARRFELALLPGPKDTVLFETLHADREVVIWLSPSSGSLSSDQVASARAAILKTLDRPNYGDNENPRVAGRDALTALGSAVGRMAVIQLFNEFGSVKYFRSGWKQPLSLGPRGIRDADGIQQFDEGGTTGVRGGGRVFLTGALQYEGQFGQVEQLAGVWPGGKASRLYEAILEHWKTKKTDRALMKLALAAASDGAEDVTGLALVSEA